MAEPDIVQKIIIEGVDTAASAFDRLGAAGEAAFNKLQQAGQRIGNIGKDLGGKEVLDQLQQIGDKGESAFNKLTTAVTSTAAAAKRMVPSLQQIGARLQVIGAAASRLKSQFSEFGSSVTAVGRRAAFLSAAVSGAVLGFFALVKSAADTADEVAKVAEALGLTTKELQGLQFVASQSGLATDALTKGLAKLINTANISEKKNLQLGIQQNVVNQQFLQGAISAEDYLNQLNALGAVTTTNVIDPFLRLGISVRNANGSLKDVNTLLLDLADAFHFSNDEALKSQVLFEAFGARVGTRFANALNKGRVGIQALIAEQNRIAPAFTKTEISIGVNFSDALDRLEKAFASLKNSFLLQFAPLFTDIFGQLVELIVQNRQAILDFGSTIVEKILPPIRDLLALLQGQSISPTGFIGQARQIFIDISTAAQIAFTIIKAGWADIVSALQPVADIINKVFGTELTGQSLAILLVVGQITGAFRLLSQGIRIIFGSLSLLDTLLVAAFGPEGALLGGLAALGVALGVLLAKILPPLLDAAATWIEEKFNQAWADVTTFAQAQLDEFAAWFESTWLGRILSVVGQVIRAISSLQIASNSQVVVPIPGQARGGPIYGPGTSTSDSILARLSRGEYVIRAAAVDKYGVAMLDAINGMRLPLRALRGFAFGGFVDVLRGLSPAPRYAYATGGAAQTGGRPIVLNIDGQAFNLATRDGDTADRLVRYAVARKARSAGRKPGYYGGSL